MARGNQPSLAFGRLIAILVPPSEDAIALLRRHLPQCADNGESQADICEKPSRSMWVVALLKIPRRRPSRNKVLPGFQWHGS